MRKAAVYGGTRNIYEQMRVAVTSLLTNNQMDRVYLLIEDDEFPFDMPENVVPINVSGQTFFPPDGANAKCKWTYMCMMRCVLTRILPDEHRVLWLDCDTIVDADITELFETDMKGNLFAGCIEHRKGEYINTGVLLMDLDAIRADGLDDVLICVLNHQKLELPDQDAINELARGRILFLDSKYNVCCLTVPPEEQKIIHFAGQEIYDNDPLYRKYSGRPHTPRTLIAVPTYGKIDADFVRAFCDLERDENTSYTFIKNTLIYNARNVIAQNAIRYGFDRVLWLDDDIIVPPDALMKLSQSMDNGKDFVTGIYFMKTFPSKPVVYSDIWYEIKSNEASAGATNITEYSDTVFEVAGSGFGCAMTSVLMLKKLVERYGAPFTPMMGLGEDVAFCWRAKQNGFRLFCDGRVKCGHIGQTIYDENAYLKTRGENDGRY